LGTYTAIPSFFPHFKSTVEVIFLNAVEYRLRFHLHVKTLFPNVVPSVSFTKQNHRGLSPTSREDGERYMLLLVTNSVVFGDMWAGALL
jgi:hypothetical protein